MNKKTFFIILVAIGIVALFALLWWWFLHRAPASSVTKTSTFGSGQNKNGTGGASANTTNIPSSLAGGSGAQEGTNIPQTIDGGTISVSGSGTGADGSYGDSSLGYSGNQGQVGTPGVVWVGDPIIGTPDPVFIPTDGSTSGSSGGTGTNIDTGTQQQTVISTRTAGTIFNPTAINGVLSSNPTGGVIPTIGGQTTSSGGDGGLGLLGTLGVAGAAGALSCSGVLISEYATSIFGGTAAGAAAVTKTGFTGAAATAAISVSSSDAGVLGALVAIGGLEGSQIGKDTADTNTDFLSCIARTIAKMTIQTITRSVVDWINGGFTGSPSFVTNPERFFTNIADNAAGQFIQGSELSFLCSPFSLQVKVAIAQSYARRGAQSCTLTQVSNNITSFMDGNFSSGGWAAMLALTTTPTNNPYGAYAYGEIALNTRVNNALTRKINDLAQGRGFLSFEKEDTASCKMTQTPPASSANVRIVRVSTTPLGTQTGQTSTLVGDNVYRVCNIVTVTPGSAIAGALDANLDNSLQSLNLAKSFDEIINALVSQLMTRAITAGLSTLSGNAGYGTGDYTPDQLQAQQGAQELLLSMQTATSLAQQYGGVEQNSISDIQAVQQQLNTLYNCWGTVEAASSSASVQAHTNAAQATTTIAGLNANVDLYNSEITRANGVVAALQTFQSRVLSAASTDEVSAIKSDYQSTFADGGLITQTDITSAQQNRTSLQNQMATLSQQTSAQLSQCYAFTN